MNFAFLMIVAALNIDPQVEATAHYYAPPVNYEQIAAAQTAPRTYAYDEEPQGKTAQVPSNAPIYPPQGFIPDPFVTGTYNPEAGMAPGYSFGPVGPQPYKFGWTTRGDVGYIPKTHANQGDLSIFELNAAWRYTTGWPPSMPNWIFSWTPEFNLRTWDGPNFPGLPGHAFRFASDFEFATPGNNPVSLQLGFTPALATDLDGNINSESFNWDGRGVLFFRTNPELMIALGAAYLDRVQDRIIPYAGVVWTPNQYWEWRLMFPKSRVSVFVGNWWGNDTWMYAGVEYNLEAYQIGILSPTGEREKVQFTDYRAMFGIRGEGGGVSSFAEVGWVFGREVDYMHGTPGFDMTPNVMVRAGLRY